MATKAKPPGVAKGGSRSNQLALWLSAGFVVLIIMSLPSVILIFFGMLPTIVAFIIDRSKQRNASFCVGGINFCGVFPYLMELWAGSNSMDMSATFLTDVFSLFIMYGAAAFGWMIYLTLSPVIASFLSVMAQHKVSTMRATQRKLIEEWGDDVSTSQDVLDLRNEIAAGEGTEEEDEELEEEDFLEGIDSLLESGSPPPPPTSTMTETDAADIDEQPPRSAATGS